MKLGSGAPSMQSLDHTVKQQEGSRTGPTTWPTLSVPHPYPSSAILKAKPHFPPLNDMKTVSWEAKQLVQSEISAQIARTQVLGWAHHQALPTGTGSGDGRQEGLGM